MKNVPELRFKEFSGEWIEEKFGQLFSFVSTNSFSREKLNYNTGKIKNIHYGDIHTKFRTLFDIKKEYVPFINEEILDKKINDDNFCIEGDLIIADASEDYEAIGKTIELINLNCEKIIAGLHTIMARPVNNNIAIGFAGYLMQSDNVRYQIKMIAQGVKVLSISSKRLKEIFLNIPDTSEQQKIASFLSAIDKKIELTDKKLECLESYKKGLMQKLLTGKVRFPGFNDEWKEEKLGNILKERQEYTSKNNNSQHLSLTINGILLKTERYNRDFLVKNLNKKYKITYKNDICYNPANLKFGVICKNNFGKGIFSPIYVTFEVNKNFNKNFIGYFIRTKKFIKQALKYQEGTIYERMSVNPEDLLSIKIKLPSLPEQQKIASFLSAIDKKIELTKSGLENIKSYKKGLLQKMFV